MSRFLHFLFALILGVQCLFAEGVPGVKVRLEDSHDFQAWNEHDPLPIGAKVFTGSKGSWLTVRQGVRIELGKESVLIVRKTEEGESRLLLTRGRMRVLTEHRSLMVQTPSCEIQITHGKADIIIANLNTLCIGREGEGIRVRSKLDEKKVPTEHYVLATPQGGLIVKQIEKDNEFGDEGSEDDQGEAS